MRFYLTILISLFLVPLYAQIDDNTGPLVVNDLNLGTSDAFTDSASFYFFYQNEIIPQTELASGSDEAMDFIHSEYHRISAMYQQSILEIQKQIREAGIVATEIKYVGEIPVANEVLQSNQPTGAFAVPLPEDQLKVIETADRLYITSAGSFNLLIYAQVIRTNSTYSVGKIYGLVSLYNDLPFEYDDFRVQISEIIQTAVTATENAITGTKADGIAPLKKDELSSGVFSTGISISESAEEAVIYQPDHPENPVKNTDFMVLELPVWKDEGLGDSMNRYLEVLTAMFTPFQIRYEKTVLGKNAMYETEIEPSFYQSAYFSDGKEYFIKPIDLKNSSNGDILLKCQLRLSIEGISLIFYSVDSGSWY